MPHQCTGCGHTFEDGSKEMLSGCPECGGNKFQFRPSDAALSDPPDDETAPTEDAPGADSSVAETVGRATTKMRDFVSSDSSPTAAPSDEARSDAASADTAGDSGSAARSETTATGGRPEPNPDPNAAWPSESDPADGTGGDTPSGSGGDTPDDEIIDADARRIERLEAEDNAQASARTDVVSTDSLDDGHSQTGSDGEHAAASGPDPAPQSGTDPESTADAAGQPAASGPDASESPPAVDADGEVVSEPTGEEPDIDELREHLNDQFESIKILEPGQYELNLMELYDREEYIIALQENGRYVIQVPEQWIGDEPGLE
jgi:predicted  nucleic acid-binding Zn-ribbon protein